MRTNSLKTTMRSLRAGVLVGIFAFLISNLSAINAQDPNRQLVLEAPGKAGRRIALVIGNGTYANAPALRNPPNDARDMALMLRSLGFDVTSGINIGQKEMKRLIREFGIKLKGGGTGLFYYAGHGVQSKSRNYLIPVDADIQSEAEVEDSGVDAALMLNFMDEAQNGLNIVILDACRNNPFARSFRSANDGLAQVDAPTGTLIAYATAPGRVASDGTGQNGLYTSELLKQMQASGVSITEILMRVRAEVMKQTDNKQVPWEASSLVGSFYFRGGAPNTPSQAPVTPINTPQIVGVDPIAIELSFWDSIKSSTNANDFNAYLEKYPQGQFAPLAKNKLGSLTGERTETRSVSDSASTAELAFWDSVKTSSNPEDFRAYVKKYPSGAFLDLAQNRLNVIEQQQKAEDENRRLAALHKTYNIQWGFNSAALGNQYFPGRLVLSPGKMQVVNDGTEGGQITWGCADFKKAVAKDNFIREIGCGVGKCRLVFGTSADALEGLNGIKEACASPSKK